MTRNNNIWDRIEDMDTKLKSLEDEHHRATSRLDKIAERCRSERERLTKANLRNKMEKAFD